MTSSAKGLTTRQLLAAVELPLSTLNRWVDQGLVTPSLLAGQGKRHDRYWTPQDLVLVRLIKALREAGCPLRQIKMAQERLHAIWHTDLTGVVLYWDGHEIMVEHWDEVYRLIDRPGQQALHIVAASVATWKIDAENCAADVDIEAIQEHRREFRERNPKKTTSTKRLRAAHDPPTKK